MHVHVLRLTNYIFQFHQVVLLLHSNSFFSDVWGPTIDLFGNKKYYMSFIDDYSKFM
jgi:hypothetical protein